MDRVRKQVKASELEINQVLHYCRSQRIRAGLSKRKERTFGTIRKIENVGSNYLRVTVVNNDKILLEPHDLVLVEIITESDIKPAPYLAAEKFRGVSIE